MGTLPSAVEKQIVEAIGVIRQGGVVAFPTETFYGLAADPFNPAAVARLFSLKKRSKNKPLLLVISGSESVRDLVKEIPEQFHCLMEQYWPGPLTLVFSARECFAPLVTAGTGTIGLRVSSHPVASRFTALAGIPLTATSANSSGGEPARTPAEVPISLAMPPDYIIDGGDAPGGAVSTVVRLSVDGTLEILREGAIPAKQLSCSIRGH